MQGVVLQFIHGDSEDSGGGERMGSEEDDRDSVLSMSNEITITTGDYGDFIPTDSEDQEELVIDLHRFTSSEREKLEIDFYRDSSMEDGEFSSARLHFL
jgi:hypothetical protein